MYKTIGRFLTLLVIPAGLWAQSLGLESGVAGVENFKVQVGAGASFMWKVGERTRASLTYLRWTGEDENYRYVLRHPEVYRSAPYFGNRGLNFVLLYQMTSGERFSTFLGVGMGRYQTVQLTKSQSRFVRYHSAYSYELLLEYNPTPQWAFYTRGILSTVTIVPVPQWGFLNLGLMYKLW